MFVWPCLVGSDLLGVVPTPTCPSPETPHSRHNMGVLNPADGNLYAVGGYDSSSHLATVEKYEPQVRNAPIP